MPLCLSSYPSRGCGLSSSRPGIRSCRCGEKNLLRRRRRRRKTGRWGRWSQFRSSVFCSYLSAVGVVSVVPCERAANRGGRVGAFKRKFSPSVQIHFLLCSVSHTGSRYEPSHRATLPQFEWQGGIIAYTQTVPSSLTPNNSARRVWRWGRQKNIEPPQAFLNSQAVRLLLAVNSKNWHVVL